MMMSNTPRTSTADVMRAQLTRSRNDVGGLAFQTLLLATLLIALVTLVAVIGEMLSRGLHVLSQRGTGFITSGYSASAAKSGVWQGVWGSWIIAMFVVALAFPVGIGSAIYLEEYARKGRLTRFITINVRNLAGVPAVVFGLVGIAIFVEGLGGGRSVISAGLTVAVLVLPIVIITASEAIRAVPQGIREAGFGIGSTRWEVTRHHVLPFAAPGILTGTVLALARALGEAAPVLLVGAATGFFATAPGASAWDRLTGPFTALPVNVFAWAAKPDRANVDNAAAGAIVMLLVLLVANSAAVCLRSRYERQR